jgi:hypothetical protein
MRIQKTAIDLCTVPLDDKELALNGEWMGNDNLTPWFTFFNISRKNQASQLTLIVK